MTARRGNTYCLTAGCAVVLLSLLASTSFGAERFPPPDFTDHQLPTMTTPAARANWLEYLDLAAVVVGLAAASYFALWRRSRRGLVLLAVGSLLWLGFWKAGCVCPIGAIQNVALGMFDYEYAVPMTVLALFALPLVFALFVGRTFCAAVCPLGAVQELVLLRPVKVPRWLEHSLGLLAYVYLGLAVLLAATGTAFLICRYDPFVGFFRLGGSLNMLVLGGCFLVLGMFVGRPYCRFLCPLGAILGLLSPLARRHVTITPTQCIQCRLCEDACPYGAIEEPTVDQSPAVRRAGRWRLGGLLVLLPVLVGFGAWLGTRLDVPLAQAHPTVRLAERMHLEQTGRVEGTTDASDAFRNTGQPVEQLHAEAAALLGTFRTAGAWFGAWVALVVGGKLIHLSVRRRRTDWQPIRANCVACGRCFRYCPQDERNHQSSLTHNPERPNHDRG